MDISYQPSGAVCRAYLEDRSPVSLIEGPVGSGKTVASLMKGFGVSISQKPFEGTRYSRGMVIRNTYPELRSTVIKSFQDWFPESIAPFNFQAPITAKLKFPLGDGTKLDLEIFFLALDRPDDIGKLKSLEVTWAALSEMSELAKAAFDMAGQRIGRYPSARMGGPSWYGLFGDSNMPDDDHWIYRLFEKEQPKGFKLFKQPGGLIFDGSEYKANPEAENVQNLPGGHEYYFRQVAGKAKEWVKVFLLAQYGTVADGKAIYPEWNDSLHVRKTNVLEDRPLLIGIDTSGFSPACAIGQLSPIGQLLIHDELYGADMDIQQFAADVLRPHLALNYHGMGFQAAGDPSGVGRLPGSGGGGRTDDVKNAFMLLANEGIPCVPTISNAFVARRNAVVRYLTRLVAAGQPAFMLDPRCDMLRRGFNGRYQFRRLQVVGEERFRDVPDKNEYSHLHDGLQYLAQHSLLADQASWGKTISYPKAGIV